MQGQQLDLLARVLLLLFVVVVGAGQGGVGTALEDLQPPPVTAQPAAEQQRSSSFHRISCHPLTLSSPRAPRQGTISGRRDIAGGRLRGDRRAAGNSSSGRAFTSLAYSADGSFLLAGGSSK